MPEGIDVDYDNVEGGQLEVALTRMNDFGNIVSSGKISVCMCDRKLFCLSLYLGTMFLR